MANFFCFVNEMKDTLMQKKNHQEFFYYWWIEIFKIGFCCKFMILYTLPNFDI
jgi:hypothetical protein